jgi:predicted homoserine dehydrogenase-like protein
MVKSQHVSQNSFLISQHTVYMSTNRRTLNIMKYIIILSDKPHHSLLRPFHMTAGSVVLAATQNFLQVWVHAL